MKDKRGLFYYPFPRNKYIRMYMRQKGDDIEFRLWNQDDPELWKQHGWIPHEAIRQAYGMYHPNGSHDFDPNKAYDIGIARELLKED